MEAAATDCLFLEINLISAQGLQPPGGNRRLQAYAIIWIDSYVKLRTLVDRVGGENPTWNDKFLFRVHPSFLADDSPSAYSVEIYAAGGWYLPDSLVGSVRFLVGNLRLLSRHSDRPVFDAVGIRRPSGRFQGVLNVGAAVLGSVPAVAARALAIRPAIGYRSLMSEGGGPKAKKRRPLRERNKASSSSSASSVASSDEERTAVDADAAFCGPCVLGFPRRLHPARNLDRVPWATESSSNQPSPPWTAEIPRS
ncbi:hypothetical protein BHE74_00018450 [Ensete ventricosum]|nr:hypothetical protein GW17_00054954 [Ensete ventricosum]RWW73668.1 hypothetical protein BHE74_00018450 [Ensete ventricosum]RZR97728.1 hypothetical protein BHM03_00026965 [Ensete ventricosum]